MKMSTNEKIQYRSASRPGYQGSRTSVPYQADLEKSTIDINSPLNDEKFYGKDIGNDYFTVLTPYEKNFCEKPDASDDFVSICLEEGLLDYEDDYIHLSLRDLDDDLIVRRVEGLRFMVNTIYQNVIDKQIPLESGNGVKQLKMPVNWDFGRMDIDNENDVAYNRQKLVSRTRIFLMAIENGLSILPKQQLKRLLLDQDVNYIFSFPDRCWFSLNEDGKVQHPRLLRRIYNFREHFGINLNYGFKHLLNEEMIGQVGNDGIEQMELEEEIKVHSYLTSLKGTLEGGYDGVLTSIKKLFYFAGDTTETLVDIAKNVISRCVTKILSFLDGFKTILGNVVFGLIRDTITSTFKRVAEAIAGALSSTTITKAVNSTVLRTFLFGLLWVLCLLSLFVFIRIPYEMVKTAILLYIKPDPGDVEEFIEIKPEDELMEGQVGHSGVGFICGILVLLASPLIGRTSAINMHSKLKLLAASIATTTTIIAGVTAFFGILPVSLQYIASCFAPQWIRDRLNMLEWMDEATMLINVSKLPDIIGTRFYYERVVKIQDEGQVIVGNGICSENRQSFFTLFAQIVKIRTTIMQFNETRGKRKTPYSLHMFGTPGLGKSNMAETIFLACFDIPREDIYSRIVGDPYFTGFLNHKGILIDEFGAMDDKASGAEFLNLISSNTFTPSMPALDNPTCGIKGTQVNSTAVVTLANNGYPRFDQINYEATKRRRNKVVEMAIHPEHQRNYQNYKLNLAAYNNEQIAACVWARFRFCNPVRPDHAQRGEWMTFHELVDQIRTDYQEHQRLSEVLIQATTDEETRAKVKDPNELMESLLNQTRKKTCTFGNIWRMISPEPLLAHVGTEGEEEIKALVNASVQTEFPRPKSHPKRKKAKDYRVQTQPVMKEEQEILEDSDGEYLTPHENTDKPVPQMTLEEKRFARKILMQNRVQNIINRTFKMTKEVDTRAAEFREWMKAHSFQLLFTAAGIGLSVFFLIKNLLTGEKEEAPKLENLFGHSASRAPTTKQRTRPKYSDVFKWKGHSGANISANQVSISAGKVRTRAIGIKDRWVVFESHFLNTLVKGDIMTLTWNKQTFTMPYNSDLIREATELDVAFLNFACPKMPKFRDISKRFVKDEDLDSLDGLLAEVHLESGSKNYVTVQRTENREYAVDTCRYRLEDAFIYRGTFVHGDCGNMLTINEGEHFGKAFGFHVAGRSKPTPIGMCTIVTQELINAAISNLAHDVIEDTEGLVGHVQFESVRIPETQRVHITRKTKIKPSILRNFLPYHPKKNLPMMRKDDPRNVLGIDPVVKQIAHIASVKHCDFPKEELKAVLQTMRKNYNRQLNWVVPPRLLTERESIMGIPGKLKSINLATSPGYPYVLTRHSKGKSDMITIIDDDYEVHPLLLKNIEKWYEDARASNKVQSVYLGYMKDELVSDSKIEEGRIRIIFSAPLHTSCVVRQQLGSLLAAFNHSWKETPVAVGLNQYSGDMESIYSYLTEVSCYDEGVAKFFAGDCKGFDRSLHPDVMEGVLDLLVDLAEDRDIPLVKGFRQAIKDDILDSPVQVDDHRYWFRGLHKSGNPLTTILNSLAHECYWRIVFSRLCPLMKYDEHVRAKFCGDDNIVAVNARLLPVFNDLTYSREVIKFNMVYTSDDKVSELTGHPRLFEDCSFLGAVPRIIEGVWCGALKTSTLEETPLWTRDRNLSISDICSQMMEMSSIWGNEYYDKYVSNLTTALARVFRRVPQMPGWLEMARIQKMRTSDKAVDFVNPPWFIGHTLEEVARDLDECFSRDPIMHLTELSPDLIMVGHVGDIDSKEVSSTTEQHDTGLTQFDNTTTMKEEDGDDTISPDRVKQSINDAPLDLSYATDSAVHRMTLTWSSIQTRGHVLMNQAVPFGLLLQGDQNTMQNMPFNNFAMWHGKVKVHFQINGTPFQQGLLVACFVPLWESTLPIQWNLATTLQHVMIKPSGNQHVSLEIPFTNNRNALKTQWDAATLNTFGRVFVFVYSSLEAVGTQSVEISVYLSLPESKFFLPKPPSATKFSADFGYVDSRSLGIHSEKTGVFDSKSVKFTTHKPPREKSDSKEDMQGHGGTASKSVNISNNFSHSSIAGDMPFQMGSDKLDAHNSVEAKLDTVVPMDNPPLASSTIPVLPYFGGMSKSNGVETTTSMQLHPAAMARTLKDTFPCKEEETDLAYMCGKQSLLAHFSWNTTQVAGTELWTIPLTPCLQAMAAGGITPAPSWAPGATLVELLADKNWFWRGNLKFEFKVVKCPYQTGRLKSVVTYGSDAGVSTVAANSQLAKVMDFSGEVDTAYLTIPFNSLTSWMRTYNGPGMEDVNTDANLGYLSIFVANILRSPSATASNQVEVLVFYSMEEPQFAVPRNYGFYASGQVSITSAQSVLVTYEPDQAVSEQPKKWLRLADGRVLEMESVGEEFDRIKILGHDEFSSEMMVGHVGDNVTELISQKESEETSVPLTKTEVTNERSQMCKLHIGAQFEYPVASLLDQGRRYGPINLGISRSQDIPAPVNGFAQMDSVVGFPNIPQKQFCSLYAGWKGTLKYRILLTSNNATHNPPRVFFWPYDKVTINEEDYRSAIAGIGLWTFPSATYPHYVSGPHAGNGTVASEMFYTQGPSYIDISIPFQYHKVFQTTDRPTGLVFIMFDKEANLRTQIYQSFGDDFRLGLYRASAHVEYNPPSFDLTAPGSHTVGSSIAGLEYRGYVVS